MLLADSGGVGVPLVGGDIRQHSTGSEGRRRTTSTAIRVFCIARHVGVNSVGSCPVRKNKSGVPAGRRREPIGLRQVQLPGHAEAVLDPPEAAAEPIVVERHQEFAALAEGGAEFGDLLFALACDE